MRAVIKDSPRPGIAITDVEEPSAGPGEVLLKVVAASICGTDIHLYDWNPWAQARVHLPRVMGHEICGEVVALGEGVDGRVRVGDRVAVESHLVCHRCPECLRGDFHVCANTRIIGVDADGGFATLVALPSGNVWPVGPEVAPEVAAAMEPFGNAVHACSYGELAGVTVAVFGCGPIGCAAVAVAKARGAARVIAVEPNRYRLELAERMGADVLVQSGEGSAEAEVRRAAGGEVDCALEMSGAPVAVVAATRLVRSGGWVSLLGIGDAPSTLDLSQDVVMRGVTLFGVTGRRLYATWEETSAHLHSGAIDASALITHHFAMADIGEAIALIKSGRCGKVSLRP
ncbi:MAG: alcohol dehydrogenase catalytic domain-containing protein [Candidatus Dormibacteria bacterium]|nr:L-threonine 3-dehydrogenase [Chloroflexota bacterium]HBV94171.1 L-threonine 3-dehydrogenase [Chloroflexota bacterium]